MGADPFNIQIVAYDFQLLLDCSFADWENQIRPSDAVPQAIVFNVLLNQKRDSKHTPLSCFLLHHFQTVAVSVPYDIARSEFDDVTDPQTQVPLQHQSSGDPVIRAATTETFPHSLDNLPVLLRGQHLGFLVHGNLPW